MYAFNVAIKKMENSLLRMYLVNACTNNKPEKVHEFFEKLGNDLQHQLEWKDWFGKKFIFKYYTLDKHLLFLVFIQLYLLLKVQRKILLTWSILQDSGKIQC